MRENRVAWVGIILHLVTLFAAALIYIFTLPTKADFQSLETRIESVRTELKTDIESVRTELKTDIESVRTELKTDIESVRTELKTDIESVRTELKADIKELQDDVDGLPRNHINHLAQHADVKP